jgi:hypothetical protein
MQRVLLRLNPADTRNAADTYLTRMCSRALRRMQHMHGPQRKTSNQTCVVRSKVDERAKGLRAVAIVSTASPAASQAGVTVKRSGSARNDNEGVG